MDANGRYRLEMKDNTLSFRTVCFKAEKGSVLHTDIFNRELAAMLSAGAIVTIAGIFFVLNFKITFIYYVMALALFGVSFFILRSYVFHEPVLCAVFDRGRGVIDIAVKKILGEIKETYNISEVEEIRLRHIVMKPENPDGIKVVMNVSLQHGTVIPGFGEEENFYTVQLHFRKKDVLLFSSKDRAEAQKVMAEIKGFMRL